MNLQQLTYFIVVGEYLHFGRAAQALYIAQPALSQSIAGLESELNVKLLDRTSKKVSLTSAGKIFLQEAREIVERVNLSIQRVRLAESGYAGMLSIGVLGGLSKGDFPRMIADFKAQHPHVALTLHQTNVLTMNRGLVMGEIDLALTRTVCIRSNRENLTWVPFERDQMSFFIHKNDPRAEGAPNLADWADEPFIILDSRVTPDMHALILQICARRGLVPRIVYTAPTLEVAAMLLRAGLGVSVLPECAIAYGEGEITCHKLEGEDCESDIILAWNKNSSNPIVPVFLDALPVEK